MLRGLNRGWDPIVVIATLLCFAPMLLLLVLGGPLSDKALTPYAIGAAIFSAAFWLAIFGAPHIVMLFFIHLSPARRLRLFFVAASVAMLVMFAAVVVRADMGPGSLLLEGLPFLSLLLAIGSAIVGGILIWICQVVLGRTDG